MAKLIKEDYVQIAPPRCTKTRTLRVRVPATRAVRKPRLTFKISAVERANQVFCFNVGS